ncbi:MAG: M36 family metallopeptidase [Saprospiraceae bacterium]|nr:M36 family metallopeptidase [Saprospiraceae bacterium]
MNNKIREEKNRPKTEMKVVNITYMLILLYFSLPQIYGQGDRDVTHALAYLQNNKVALRIEDKDIKNFRLDHVYQDQNTKARHIYFQQIYIGMEIKNAMMIVTIDHKGQVTHVGNSCVPHMSKVTKSTHSNLQMRDAVVLSAMHLGIEKPDVPSLSKRSSGDEGIFEATPYVKSDIRVKPIYEYDESINRLILCYQVTLDLADSDDLWEISVDQNTGKVVTKNNLSLYCTHTTHDCSHQNSALSEPKNMHSPASIFNRTCGNIPQYRVYPFPMESPLHGPHTLVSHPSIKSASPEGWHTADGIEFNTTKGNNVIAYLNADGDDSPDPGSSVIPKTNLLFDYPHSITQDPELYKDASQVNLFYAANMMHDISFLYGFTEEAGNFQSHNYSGRGKENDPVICQSFDGFNAPVKKRNNAVFTSPADGGTGKLQIFLWDRYGSAVKVTAPSEIATDISIYGTTTFGAAIPKSQDSPVFGKITVVGNKGSNESSLGCKPVNQNLHGTIAMVDRGECDFIQKVYYAQQAGASACIICNVAGVNGGTGEEVNPVGAPPNSPFQVTIPSIFVRKSDCDKLRAIILRGTDVFLKMQEPAETSPKYRDGAFDNVIIAHEYAHGISTRLTGGPNNSSCLINDEQMGEGWSDFFALAVTAKQGDNGRKPRGVGNFSINQAANGNGIRRYPYSTDMSINPQTYNNIKGTDTPHQLGEVWTSMLWDLYWAMAEKYGFDPDVTNINSGNGKAIQLVMQGMKMQSCKPGFIDGRDAILAADRILFNGDNKCLIWSVFAKRGLGILASGGSNNDRNDGIEDFNTFPSCIEELKIMKKMPEIAKSGSSVKVELKAINHIPNTLKNVSIVDSLPSGFVYIDGTATLPATVKEKYIIFNIGDMKYEQEAEITYQLKAVSPPSFTKYIYKVEKDGQNFQIVPNIGSSTWTFDDNMLPSGQTGFFIPATSMENDHSLFTKAIRIDSEKPVLKFLHKYKTRQINDGGYLSISKDGGLTWEIPHFIFNGPKDAVNYSTFAIPNLKVFTGDSGGEFVNSYVDLSDYLGEQIIFRIRFGTKDTSTLINGGWWIAAMKIFDANSGASIACIQDGANLYSSCTSAKTILIDNNLLPTNTKEESISTVMLYPNPASDIITLTLDNNLPSVFEIRIIGIDGKIKMLESFWGINGRNEIPIDIVNLENGMFLFEVNSKNFNRVLKFLKIH